MQRRFGSYLDEYLLSQAFTGSLTLTVGGVAQTIDYGIPSGNKPTAGVSWATSTTDIIGDLTTWKRLIVKATGMTPRWAVCNQTVMNYLMKNDHAKELMGQTATGIQIAENGYITHFHGLNWIVLDHHFAAAGSPDSFNTPFIADDKLLLLPDISSEWITMQRGTCLVPNQSLTDVMETQGPVMWSRVSDSPTGLVLYYKNARLPAIKIPQAIVYAETTP